MIIGFGLYNSTMSIYLGKNTDKNYSIQNLRDFNLRNESKILHYVLFVNQEDKPRVFLNFLDLEDEIYKCEEL